MYTPHERVAPPLQFVKQCYKATRARRSSGKTKYDDDVIIIFYYYAFKTLAVGFFAIIRLYSLRVLYLHACATWCVFDLRSTDFAATAPLQFVRIPAQVLRELDRKRLWYRVPHEDLPGSEKSLRHEFSAGDYYVGALFYRLGGFRFPTKRVDLTMIICILFFIFFIFFIHVITSSGSYNGRKVAYEIN